MSEMPARPALMRCLPSVTIDTDLPFWVTRVAFFEHFDQADFHCRKSQTIMPTYLRKWFPVDRNGAIYFSLPAVHFVQGRTQFINGRHRTAVLLNFMDAVPLAFDSRFMSASDKRFLDRITTERLDLAQEIELPALPIQESLP